MNELISFDSSSSLLQIQQGYLEAYFDLLYKQSSEEIAALFVGQGIKGQVGSCTHCALAEWARKYWEGFGPHQSLGVFVAPWVIRVNLTSGTAHKISLPVPSGSALFRFICDFDSHKFPQLIRS